ncbi:MAG: hypothetical protein V4613_13255 [Bacteroidota bacterium]
MKIEPDTFVFGQHFGHANFLLTFDFSEYKGRYRLLKIPYLYEYHGPIPVDSIMRYDSNKYLYEFRDNNFLYKYKDQKWKKVHYLDETESSLFIKEELHHCDSVIFLADMLLGPDKNTYKNIDSLQVKLQLYDQNFNDTIIVFKFKINLLNYYNNNLKLL